jgi:hypothetical protein
VHRDSAVFVLRERCVARGIRCYCEKLEVLIDLSERAYCASTVYTESRSSVVVQMYASTGVAPDIGAIVILLTFAIACEWTR